MATITPKMTIGPVPPIGQVPGDFWWNDVNGFLFVWYDDGNTAQWVVANPGRGSTFGPQGETGATGPAGPQGPPGSVGPIGPLGPTGPTGAQGPQGPAGPPGPTGLQGSQGPIGPSGPTGDIGPAGPAGPQGPQGVQGVVGPQGVQGPSGQSTVIIGSFGVSKVPSDLPANGMFPANWDAPGSPAVAFTMTVGNSLIYTGADSGVFKSGDLFVFLGGPSGNPPGWVDAGNIRGPTGPQGVAGATGAQGPQGVSGPQGVAGPQGPIGLTGPQGSQGVAGPPGVDGAQGPAGATGSTGAQGPAGSTGAPGATGSQGPQGVKGDKGDKGDIGNTGAQGPQGAQGVQGNTGPQGTQGNPGATGPAGTNGAGVPTGGTAGQLLQKNSATDFATIWVPNNSMRLYDEVVLAAAAAEMRVNIPAGAKAIELWFLVNNTGNVNDNLLLNGLNGAAILNANTHNVQFGSFSGSIASGAFSGPGTAWALATAYANLFGVVRPILMATQTLATADYWAITAANSRNKLNCGLDSGPSGPTGFRLANQGGTTLAAGSYLRSLAIY